MKTSLTECDKKEIILADVLYGITKVEAEYDEEYDAIEEMVNALHEENSRLRNA